MIEFGDLLIGDASFLLVLLPLFALLLWAWRRPRQGVDGASRLVLGSLPRTWRARTTWLPSAVLGLALLMLAIALARPLQGRQEARVITEGVDIMIVIDRSSSMLESTLEDGRSNLDVVKSVVAEFVAGRENDRVGLLSFARYPRTECPLTLDKDAVLRYLADVECVRVNSEEDGTGIGVALGQAALKLRDSDAKSRVVVLLTDGEENQQHVVDPEDAAALCSDEGIRVYTIAAGQRVVRRSIFGGATLEPLDTTLLEQISSSTGGRTYRARSEDLLARAWAEIDALEKTEREDVRYTDYDDLYPGFLLCGLVLLGLELLLSRGSYLELTS